MRCSLVGVGSRNVVSGSLILLLLVLWLADFCFYPADVLLWAVGISVLSLLNKMGCGRWKTMETWTSIVSPKGD